MSTAEKQKKHYNLYYIFAEDKQNNTLSKEVTANIWKNIQSAINNTKCNFAPPNENL